MVEHSTADREVTGSIPVAPLLLYFVKYFFSLSNCCSCFSYDLSSLIFYFFKTAKILETMLKICFLTLLECIKSNDSVFSLSLRF